MPAESLTAKGRQTREAIELGGPEAVRRTWLSRHDAGRHHLGGRQVARRRSTGTTPTRKTCSRCWPSRSCATWSCRSGPRMHLPDSPEDTEFFIAAVTGYWNMFKQNIGIMVAVDQLAAAPAAVRRRAERVPPLRHRHRRARRCCAPRSRATAPTSTPSTPRWPSRCCSRTSPRSTCARTPAAGSQQHRRGRGAHALDHLEEDPVRLLSIRPSRRESPWISLCPNIFRACWPRWTPSSRRRSSRWKPSTCSTSTSAASTPAPTGRTAASRSAPGRTCSTRCGAAPTRRAGCATACRRGSAAATAPTSTWRSSGNTWRTGASGCTTTCRTSRRSSATSPRSS